jgi:prevent-host-death family protein
MPDIQWHQDGDWEVPVRELRNRTSEVLRRVEAGEPAIVTVDRRPVARLVPLRRQQRPRSMPTAELFAKLEAIGGGADPGLRDELRELLPGTTDE